MVSITKINLKEPDDIQTPEKLKVETVIIGGIRIQRVTAEAGWQWSKHVKPIAGGESCQRHHLVYVLSGRMHARMNDGTEKEFGQGDAGDIPPGHDGWTVGSEPAVWLELSQS